MTDKSVDIVDLARESEACVEGNAAELAVLQKAGIERAPAVIITTHDDDMNVYLTIYCRRLRPDIQIVRLLSKLSRARRWCRSRGHPQR